MGNPFFKTHSNEENPENDLYRNATREICETYGIDFLYLPRSHQRYEHVLGEDVLGSFNSNTPLTLYIENYSEFEGNGDMYSKFGFTLDDQLTLIVEKQHFDNLMGEKPEEGDLVYHKHSGKLFEISHIKPDEGFYQFQGGRMMYKFTCTLFEFSHEEFNTGVAEIDDVLDGSLDAQTTDESDQVDTEKDEYLNFDTSDIFGNL
jgi:hypothetical protein